MKNTARRLLILQKKVTDLTSRLGNRPWKELEKAPSREQFGQGEADKKVTVAPRQKED